MIDFLELSLTAHQLLIERFGGASGVRDMASLEAAAHRPVQTFDGTELYPDTISKAAAICESIIKNHPFFDGNKRVGYFMLRFVLNEGQLKITASEDEKYFFIIKISKGELTFTEIQNWIKTNTKNL